MTLFSAEKARWEKTKI